MSWAKIDDRLHAHPKIRRAWECRPALGLHLMALSYAAAQLTDGFIDELWVAERLPQRRERHRVTGALVECGLWEPVTAGFQIHDYAEYNPSRGEVHARRKADADRKAAAREARSPAGIRKESARTGSGGVRQASALPDPTRPVKAPPNPPRGGSPLPPRPRGNRDRDRAAWLARLADWTAAHFPGEDPGRVRRAVEMELSAAPGASVAVGRVAARVAAYQASEVSALAEAGS